MEKIISFLIMFGAAALFEFVKERKKKADPSRATTTRHGQPSNHLSGNLRHLLNTRIPDTYEVTVSMPPTPSSERANTDVHRSKRPFLPGESHHRPIVAPQPQEETMELITLPELTEEADKTDQTSNTANQPNAEHYQRWRRAIMYTAILNPPYIPSTDK